MIEGRLWADDKTAGIYYCIAGVGLVVALDLVVVGVIKATGRKSWVITRVLEVCRASLWGYVAVAGKSLLDQADKVDSCLRHNDLEGARQAVAGLVGRDVSALDAHGVARATVESVAENTVDGVVAPIFWGAVMGPLGFLVYRAINTMDSMVGYKNPRYRNFGWASARLDDLASYIPARVTYLVLLVIGGNPETVREIARKQAPGHPSPNAGLAEGAFAGALGVTLGGMTVYEHGLEDRPQLGYGRPVERQDIYRAAVLSKLVQGVFATSATAIVSIVGLRKYIPGTQVQEAFRRLVWRLKPPVPSRCFDG